MSVIPIHLLLFASLWYRNANLMQILWSLKFALLCYCTTVAGSLFQEEGRGVRVKYSARYKILIRSIDVARSDRRSLDQQDIFSAEVK